MKVGVDAKGPTMCINHSWWKTVETAVNKIVNSQCIYGKIIQKQGSYVKFVESTGKWSTEKLRSCLGTKSKEECKANRLDAGEKHDNSSRDQKHQ